VAPRVNGDPLLFTPAVERPGCNFNRHLASRESRSVAAFGSAPHQNKIVADLLCARLISGRAVSGNNDIDLEGENPIARGDPAPERPRPNDGMAVHQHGFAGDDDATSPA
jgi:hypothetical protein